MYKHCNTEESVRRQRQIEQCLLELMLSVPFSHITILDICQKAGLSRKSFYRYFSSKEGCLHGLIDHSILDSSAAYLSDPEPMPSQRRVFEHYFRYWQQMKDLLEALCQNGLTNLLYERSMLCVAQEEPQFRNYLNVSHQNDADEQILFIVCGITGLIISWHLSGYQKTAAQMAATIDHLLGKSLMAYPKAKKKY